MNGQAVALTVETPADLPAGQMDPQDRTPAQVQSLQTVADDLVRELNRSSGGKSGLSVKDTLTGANITGLLDVAVPIEDTVLVQAGEKSMLFAAVNENGTVTEVQPGAVIEMRGNGEVGVAAFGLTPGESVELVVMSTPRLIGSYTVNSNGTVKAQALVPEAIKAGSHTLVVATPTVQAALGLKVSRANVAALPATGARTADNELSLALWMLTVGAAVATIARRRRQTV